MLLELCSLLSVASGRCSDREDGEHGQLPQEQARQSLSAQSRSQEGPGTGSRPSVAWRMGASVLKQGGYEEKKESKKQSLASSPGMQV